MTKDEAAAVYAASLAQRQGGPLLWNREDFDAGYDAGWTGANHGLMPLVRACIAEGYRLEVLHDLRERIGALDPHSPLLQLLDEL